MKLNDVIIEQLEIFNDMVKRELREKGMDTTGNAVNSLEVVSNKNYAASLGIDYIEYLNRGRPPGKFPPMDAIRRWIDFKGLKLHPYAVARNIAEKGTRIYRDRTKGLMLEEKVAVLEQNLNEVLPDFIRNQIVVQLNKSFTR